MPHHTELAATTTTGAPPLVPRDVLFGNPRRINPQVSPDGHWLAYIAPDDRGVLQVWLRTVGQEDDRVLTADDRRGITMYFWSYDGIHLIYRQDVDGDENWRLHAVDIHTRASRDLTPFSGVQAQVVARDPGFPNELLIALNHRDPHVHDVYRLDLRSGALTLDTTNPGTVAAWSADAQFRVRAAEAFTPDGGSDLLVRDDVDQPWRLLRHWGPEDQSMVVGFTRDSETLNLLASHDANALRLLTVNTTSGAEQVLADDPAYDAGPVLIHPTERVVQAVAFQRERLAWQVRDERVAADFAALATLQRGDFYVVNRDLADRTWLVAYLTDDGPVYYYAYRRDAKAGTLLFSHRPELEGLPLAPMQPVSFAARDGLTIHGYLTLPVGIPGRQLPTVLLVHGGPWGRDVWGFDPQAQWLANRGYAVLQVNFRGSTGYGKAFVNAGDREWAGAMHTDLLDGIAWLVGEGIADPLRVGIMGASYGGYATLVGLAFTPDVFAAGVDIVGPSNLLTLLETIPPYWRPILPLFYRRVGQPDTDDAFLRARSPLFFADQIRAPLLIGQGANDPRVKQAESDQIVEAMRQAGRPVQYVIYADEGHGFMRPANRLHFYAMAEAFLAQHLGGRCEPLGEIAGHTASIA